LFRSKASLTPEVFQTELRKQRGIVATATAAAK
jgi:hypothetical protein